MAIDRNLLLQKSKEFFKSVIVPNHIKNLNKLIKLNRFDYNPFLIGYLSRFMSGKFDAENAAKVLLYPRILGTSINTSFGQNIQTTQALVIHRTNYFDGLADPKYFYGQYPKD